MSDKESDNEEQYFHGDSENLFDEEELIGVLEQNGTSITNGNCNDGSPDTDGCEPSAAVPDDHDPESSDETAVSMEYPGDMQSGRKRRRKAKKEAWFQEVNKSKRMKGECYISYKSLKTGGTEKVTRKQRELKPTCTAKTCAKSQVRYCDRFPEPERVRIFQEFWKLLDWNQKCTYVQSLVDKHKTIRRTTKGHSRRQDTYSFYLKLNGQKRQVCKTMFLNTLGIGETQMRNWVIGKLKLPKTTPIKPDVEEKKDFASNFIDSLPKIPSHYCRKSSSKLYLEPPFSSKCDVFRQYKLHCTAQNKKSLERKAFLNILDEKNVAIFMPRKDRCDLCCGYETGNVSKEEYEEHCQKKDSAQREKEADKQQAIMGNVHVLTMDLQAVKVSPLLNASALYYKTKLIVHNFTTFDLATSDVHCFLWDESQGGLVASVFASILVEHLKSNYEDNKPIVIFSDGCVHQNRNAMMSTALLNYSMEHNKIVYQKFLEKGHTMMEVDSVHSAIERKLKGKSIFLPSDYIGVCQEARINPRPYSVKYLSFTEFRDYSNKTHQRYTSIKPTTTSGSECVTDIRQLKYNPNGTIEFKLNHSDKEWTLLPRKPKTASGTFSKLYSKKLPITKRKYDDLQGLLNVLPAECHAFYRSLSFK